MEQAGFLDQTPANVVVSDMKNDPEYQKYRQFERKRLFPIVFTDEKSAKLGSYSVPAVLLGGNIYKDSIYVIQILDDLTPCNFPI